MRRIMGWLFTFLPDHTKDALRVASARSRLSTARVTPIAEVADGQLVVVAGTLSSGISEPLIAPVSERQCVYWEVRTQRDLALHQDKASSFTHDEDSQDFFIEDDTGRALVQMTDYVVSIHPDFETTAESNSRSWFVDSASGSPIQTFGSARRQGSVC